jgi:FkbM family methyltransferase
VYAFEPHPKNFACLTKNIAANRLSHVVAVQLAVSHRVGEALLFEARSSLRHSLNRLPEDLAPEGPAAPAIAVRTVTLDDFFRGQALQPRLIKMDIEGCEPLALQGMRGLINSSPGVTLITEFNPSYLAPESAADFLKALGGLGFQVAIVDDERGQLEFLSTEGILQRFAQVGLWSAINLLCTRDPQIARRLRGTQHGETERPCVVKVTGS